MSGRRDARAGLLSPVTRMLPPPTSFPALAALRDFPQDVDCFLTANRGEALGGALLLLPPATEPCPARWLRLCHRIIALEDRTHILAGLEEEAYQVHAGGSLSNTLMALARLGAAAGAPRGGRPLRVAMAGLVGSDALGSFYAAQMERAGVEVLAPPVAGASTGGWALGQEGGGSCRRGAGVCCAGRCCGLPAGAPTPGVGVSVAAFHGLQASRPFRKPLPCTTSSLPPPTPTHPPNLTLGQARWWC